MSSLQMCSMEEAAGKKGTESLAPAYRKNFSYPRISCSPRLTADAAGVHGIESLLYAKYKSFWMRKNSYCHWLKSQWAHKTIVLLCNGVVQFPECRCLCVFRRHRETDCVQDSCSGYYIPTGKKIIIIIISYYIPTDKKIIIIIIIIMIIIISFA